MFTEDPSIFLALESAGGFAKTWNNSSESATFPAIFDNEYVEFEDISGTAPVLHTSVAAVAATPIANGDTVTHADHGTFVVRSIQGDGTSQFVMLVLEEQ